MLKYLLLFFIITPGCASFVKTPLAPNEQILSEKSSADSKNISFEVLFQSGNIIHSSKDGHKAEMEMAHDLRKYFLNSVGNSLGESSINVISTNHFIEGRPKKIWWWSSIASFGIIPFWSNNEIHFQARITKKDKKMHEISYKDNYLIIQQTLLVFLMFKSVNKAHEHIAKVQIDRFIKELHQKKLLGND